VGQDNWEILKITKELIKLLSRTLKLFLQSIKRFIFPGVTRVTLFYCLFGLFQVDERIIDANKRNHMVSIESKQLIHIYMVKI
jgi:hypothetical protein